MDVVCNNIAEIVKILISASIFFVWVVRYSNVVDEFNSFNYPGWFRDFVGLTKITFAIMLFRSESVFVLTASAGLMFLMIAALLSHVKIKNPLSKMLPSTVLFFLCFFVLYMTYKNAYT